MVSEQTRKEIFQVADEVWAVTGCASFDDGMARFKKLLEVVAMWAQRIGTRQDFAAVLDEWSQEDGESFLMALREMPYVIRALFQDAAKAAREDFPHPPGGRPAALTPEQRREVCDFIGALFARGVLLRECQRRAAQRFGASLRSVQRAWQSRVGHLDHETKLKEQQELAEELVERS